MGEYYFLASLLPSLELGHPPGLHFGDLDALLQRQLSRKDYQKTKVLRWLIDLYNLQSFLRSREKFDSRGNLSLFELENLIENLGKSGQSEIKQYEEYIPSYIIEFLKNQPKTIERLQSFPILVRTYFEKEIASSYGFLRQYLIFERDLRLVLLGLRAQNLGYSVEKLLTSESLENPIVKDLLEQKDAKFYQPLGDFREVKVLFDTNKESPFLLHKALSEYRLRKVKEFVKDPFFSIDLILAYLIRLIIIEQWLEMDNKAGISTIEDFEKVLE